MAVIVEDGRLTLTGYVGESTLEIDGWVIFDGFTHAEVVQALGEIGPDTDLTVYINSGGGVATEGTAIRSALADREGRTDIVIDGIAASAASLIAMAGETVSMSLGSLLMIHDPSGYTWGTVEEHEKTIRGLNALGDTYARVYARRSGKTDEECRAIMKTETWFTPDQAVTEGFADDALDDDATTVAAFPYHQYAQAPRDLVALAKTNNWRSPVPVAAVSKPPPQSAKPKEAPKMAKSKPAAKLPTGGNPATSASTGDPNDEKARIQAILECDAAQANASLARYLAFNTDQSAEEAIGALKAAAPEDDDSGSSASQVESYQRQRSAASDLSQPVGGSGRKPKATLNPANIYSARRKQGN